MCSFTPAVGWVSRQRAVVTGTADGTRGPVPHVGSSLDPLAEFQFVRIGTYVPIMGTGG